MRRSLLLRSACATSVAQAVVIVAAGGHVCTTGVVKTLDIGVVGREVCVAGDRVVRGGVPRGLERGGATTESAA